MSAVRIVLALIRGIIADRAELCNPANKHSRLVFILSSTVMQSVDILGSKAVRKLPSNAYKLLHSGLSSCFNVMRRGRAARAMTPVPALHERTSRPSTSLT